MYKRFFIVAIFALIVKAFTFTVFAAENFNTNVNAEYKIQDNGLAQVTNTFTIKNNRSNFYPKKFIFNLKGANPENIKAYEQGRLLPVYRQDKDGITSISVSFEQASVGKNSVKTFIVTYEDKAIAQKSGEIWEIAVPKIDDSETFSEFKTTLSVPKIFGEEAYVSPEPSDKKEVEDRRLYIFEKEKLSRAGVSAGFGKFQVFSFRLLYHLINNEDKKVTSEVALPPDTSTQRIFYESIEPKPSTVKLDEDGNWIASFNVNPKEKVDIEAKGSVQIFASPRKLLTTSSEKLGKLIKPSEYWQTDDPLIIKTASGLNGPQDIYNFVSRNLVYDFKKIGSDSSRMGAKSALENPNSALCSEYTDLFIALSRAKNIPAREINGYAYSQNPDIEPLSLVTDVLHAWPEYWDKERGVWVPTDPTWASTTGGVDFFTKFDLRHFAFVIHGTDPVKPYSAGSYKLGVEPGKDVFVSFGQLPEKRYSQLDLRYEPLGKFPLFSRKIKVFIKNTGPAAAYDNQLDMYIGSNNLKSEEIGPILPFSGYEKTLNINYGIMGSKAPEFIKVRISNQEINIPNGKNSAVVNQLLAMSTIFIIALAVYLLVIKRPHWMNLIRITRLFNRSSKN